MNQISRKDQKTNKYISLHEASESCPYSQEYLSLRARQGKLKAVKLGRDWVTTKEWVENYVSNNGKDKIKKTLKLDFKALNFKKKSRSKKNKKEKKEFRFLFYLKNAWGKTSLVNFNLEKNVGHIIDRVLCSIDKLILKTKNLFSVFSNLFCQIFKPKFNLFIFLIIFLFFIQFAYLNSSTRPDLVSFFNKIEVKINQNNQRLANFALESFLFAQKVFDIDNYVQASEFVAELPLKTQEMIENTTQRINNIPDLAFSRIQSFGLFLTDQAVNTTNFLSDFLSETGEWVELSSLKLINLAFNFDIVDYFDRISCQNEQLKLGLKNKAREMPANLESLNNNLWASHIPNLGKRLENRLVLESQEIFQGSIALSEKVILLPERTFKKASDIRNKAYHYLSDTPGLLSDTPGLLSDMAKKPFHKANKLIIAIGKSNISNISEILNYFPQKIASACNFVKSKLGDAYIKIVDIFESSAEKKELTINKDINQLEKNIIDDVEKRFNEFKGEEDKEGVVVVPIEENRDKAEERIRKISSSFSDEVFISSDNTGKSGLIEPIFQQAQSQEYLYMMVPVKEKENN